LKTINAQLWRLGAVSLAFALAITMLISTGPTTKGVEAAACVIDITESDGLNTVLVNGGKADTAVGSLTVDTVDATTAGLGFGSVVKLNTPEFVRVDSVTNATTVVIGARGVVNNQYGYTGVANPAAANIANNATITEVKKMAASNGVDCAINQGSTQTVTITSATPQIAEVWDGLRTAIPTGVSGTGVILTTAVSNVASNTDTAWTLASVVGIDVGDVGTIACTTPAGRYEQVELTTDNATAVVVRAVNGSTACETIVDTTDSVWYPWHDNAIIGAEGTNATINALASKDSYAERQLISVTTPRAAASGGYQGTFTLAGANSGKAVIAVKGFRTGVVYDATTSASSEGIITMTFRGAPSDYVDENLDGKYTAAGDPTGDRSLVNNGGSVTTSTTTTRVQDVSFNIMDDRSQELAGTATITLIGAPSTVKFTSSGTQTIALTTGTAGNDTTEVSGLPGLGNFRYTYTVDYVGTSGSLTLTGGIIHRTNNTLSVLTMSLQNRAYGATTHVTKDAATPILAQVNDDGNYERSATAVGDRGDDELDGLYYLYVVGTDSAGNPANANVTFADDDGLSTAGLGLTTGIYLDNTAFGNNGAANGHINSLALGSTGKARTGIDIAAAGIYNLTATSVSGTTVSNTITLNVRGAASTYTLTGPDSIVPGAIGVFTVKAFDANSFAAGADKAVTIVNANSQTGGAIVPANGSGTISKSTNLTISVIAPQKGGTGTLAIVVGGAVVATKQLTYAAAVTGAALSGTGCTGAATGSYTCVVTSGDTASAVATAAGAVSIWQSDADGVLQGYVVGTPDFVDTGLASTAAIASNSAVIVVR
jgi:hypothetical protein